MPTSANARVAALDAPGGLVLVQELLNTAAGGVGGHVRGDLLEDAPSAKDWADGWVDAALGGALDDDGVARLRALREDVRAAVHVQGLQHLRVAGDPEQVGLALQPSGEVEVVPAAGAAGIGGLVLAEVLLAQQRGDWARLKICALPVCGTAFYDRSRNTSARYHTAACANHVNLRNSRARRHGG